MDETAEAKALLNNEVFKGALERAQKDFISAAISCDLKDDEGRRLNLSAARIVAAVSNHIVALATNASGEPVEIPDFYEERAKRRFAFFSK